MWGTDPRTGFWLGESDLQLSPLRFGMRPCLGRTFSCRLLPPYRGSLAGASVVPSSSPSSAAASCAWAALSFSL